MVSAGCVADEIAAVLGLTKAEVFDKAAHLGVSSPADGIWDLPTDAMSLDKQQIIVALWCAGVGGVAIGKIIGHHGTTVYKYAKRWRLYKRRNPGEHRRARAPILRYGATEPSLLSYIQRYKGAAAQRGWTQELEREIERRWFCLQTPQGIARDLGLTKSTVATKAFRLELPKRYGLPLTDDFDPARKDKHAHLFAGWERKVCCIRKQPFWSNVRGVRWSKEAKRKATYRDMMLGGD